MALSLKHLRGRWAFLAEAVILLALSAGLAALANAAHPDGLPWTPAPVAEPAAQDASDVDFREAMRLLDSGQALFLDARAPEDFALAHIPGAESVPPGLFAEDVEALLGPDDPERPLVAYCSNVHCPLARRLADALHMIGYENVLVYEGGMHDWTAQGGPVEAGAAAEAGAKTSEPPMETGEGGQAQ